MRKTNFFVIVATVLATLEQSVGAFTVVLLRQGGGCRGGRGAGPRAHFTSGSDSVSQEEPPASSSS